MATFLVRALDWLGAPMDAIGNQTFDDVPANGVHADDISRLAARGIVQGTGDGRYLPVAAVTRAPMAAFVMRAADYATTIPVATPPSFPEPGTATDPCGLDDLVETHLQVTVTSTLPGRIDGDGAPYCLYGYGDGAIMIKVDAWVPAPEASRVAMLYSAEDLFVGDAGVGVSAVVQHSDHNVTTAYVDMGQTSLEASIDGGHLSAAERMDAVLALFREAAPRLWPDAEHV